MGWYTAVVLSWGSGDECLLEKINDYDLNSGLPYRQPLVYSDPDSECRWGSNALPCSAAQASIKCTCGNQGTATDYLVHFLRNFPWPNTEDVQLFWLDEHDEKWSLHDFPFPNLRVGVLEEDFQVK